MISVARFLTASLAVVLAGGVAFGAELRRGEATTKVGQEVRFSVHSSYGSDCKGGPKPKVTVLIGPRNGVITVRNSIEVVSNRDSPCFGKKIPGTGVFYKPNKGFKGEDRFLFDRLTADRDLVFSVYGRVLVK